MTPDVAAERPTDDLGDADLVLRTRAGDGEAFAELWRRHYRSGVAVARSVSSSLDPDDLVQESYTRIYQSIQNGGGPTGSFRAYLFTSIRNTAATWGRARRETAIDVLDTLEDPATTDEATAEALDRGLTNQAFRSLPTRWQEVLWYTEIEQMKPSEVAPLLGMKASAVAQLAFRAREGLREAWIQAHLRSVEDDSACQWTIERLGAYARSNVSRRDRRKIDEHLSDCARCTIVAGEAEEVSHRLALVLLPLTVGIAGTAGYLASLQGGAVPTVAMAMPSTVIAGGTPPPSGVEASGAAASSSPMSIGAMVSLVAATAVVAGGVFAGAAMLGDAGDAFAPNAAHAAAADLPIDASIEIPEDSATTEQAQAPRTEPSTPAPAVPAPGPGPGDGVDTSETRAAAPAPVAPTVPAPAPGDVVDPGEVSDPVEPAADAPADEVLPDGAPVIVSSSSTTAEDGTIVIAVELSGEPGATVRARTHGHEDARTTLDDDGTGTLVLSVEPWEVLTGTRLELRYVAGDRVGSPTGAKLADLV